MPAAEVMAPVEVMRGDIDELISQSETDVNNFMATAVTTIIISVLIVLTLAVILSIRFSKGLSSLFPLQTEERSEQP
jgi:hypothetical protein